MTEVLNQHLGERFAAYNADCVEFVSTLPDASVGFSVYSPPFAHLFVYSDSERDMGNVKDEAEFKALYAHLVREKYRVTKPGRLTAVHCSDLPRTKSMHGVVGLYDFPADIREVHEAAGWTFHSRVTVWKDPVVEMQRTKALGLLYKQIQTDATRSRQGMADYVMVFRKTPGNETAARHAAQAAVAKLPHDATDETYNATWDAAYKAAFVPGDEATSTDRVGHDAKFFPVDQWQQWASPVWMDINQTNVLNAKIAREDKDERHLCPLQLDLIERAIRLWSNPGDTVLSPFMGIGSEGWVALKAGRRFIGTELKASYFNRAVRNLLEAEAESAAPSLLSLAGVA